MNMKLKTFLLVISLMMHLVSWGYSTSDTFYDNGIKYQVTGTNYSNLTCKAIGYDKTIFCYFSTKKDMNHVTFFYFYLLL